MTLEGVLCACVVWLAVALDWAVNALEDYMEERE